MNTYLMKKAMIESAVSQGIRQMKEDPERAARRMVDLGKQFSHNRFQDMIFSVIQELLDNDRSSYYDMLHNLLKNTDEKAIQKFGVNFGYMGWTYGASLIRQKEKECGHCLPWAITLRYDPAGKKGLTIEQLEDLISQGQKLGIFVYFIREMGDSGAYTLLEVFERCRDCAFVAFSHSGRVTAAQIEILKLCKNTVISFPVDDPESMLTASLLRDQKIFFALHYLYDDKAESALLPNLVESTIASESAFLFAIARDGTAQSLVRDVTDECYHSRLSQNVPTVCIDFYGDDHKISQAICEHPYLFELDEEGYIVNEDGTRGPRYDTEKPLLDTLREVMPAYPCQEV
ncbi:MAG: hypothetical protein LKE85_05750 [Lachnospiraceae bacterium]|nr:hypothetical protein [Lachnospiraceae bacterium]